MLHFDYEMVRRRPQARAAGQLRAGAHRAAGGRDGRSEAASLRDHRSARRARSRHRRLQGRLAGRRRAARRPSGLFRDLLPRARARARRCSTCARPSSSSCSKVRELHPESPKPAIVGNCQGGWAAMMLAASDPDDTGPIVINGAPMSYWGGAWQEGEGDNPMRYAGGMLGGTWLASFAADLGDGMFDGAYLVENFENLNPANTFWDKYYNLFANVDTEPPRFLEFERWWGGFYLMNREEIEWITRNLFVGNKLWTAAPRRTGGKAFDLRDIKVADHPVRVDGRQHHAAAAGVQLGRRRLRLDRGDQGARPGDRRPAARGHRPPRHLRVRQGGEEGARADRLGAEVDRGAAARPVRHGDPRAQGPRRQGRVRGRVPSSAGSRTSSRGSTASSAPTRSRSRRSPRCPSSTSAPTSCSRSRSCRRCRTRSPPKVARAVPSAALAALGDVRPESVARVARPRRRRRSRRSASRCTPDNPGAQGRADAVGRRSARRSTTTARCATRRARRRSSRPTATCSRSTSPTSARPASAPRRARSSRASCRSSRTRWRRSAKAAFPRRWPASASLLARKGEPLPLERGSR